MAAAVVSLPSPNTSTDGLFSKLPDDILHQILCSLTLRQRASKASLVSRKWQNIIASFNDHKFIQKHSFCPDHPHSPRLKHPYCELGRNFRPALIRLAADKSSITEFYLLKHSSSSFRVSLDIFESRLLTVLHLKGCNTTVNAVHVDFNHIKGMPLLKEIHLDSVCICTYYLSKDIKLCPSIVELTITKCHVSPTILEPEFCFSAFPHLKSLSLQYIRGCRRIKILNPELESLSLIHIVGLDDAIIDTPNLRSFKLIGITKVPKTRPTVGLRLTEVEIELKHVHPVDRLCLLRTYVENLGETITLSLATELKEGRLLFMHQFLLNIRPVCIKHIDLEILSLSVPRFEYLVNELFSYFHPRTLLVRGDNSDDFQQVLLNELKGPEREGIRRYKFTHGTYWRYLLKGFEILESTTQDDAHQIIHVELRWFN